MDRLANWLFGKQDGALIVFVLATIAVVVTLVWVLGPSSFHQPLDHSYTPR